MKLRCLLVRHLRHLRLSRPRSSSADSLLPHVVRVAVRVVGVASAAVGLFLVAVDCVSLPSRASSADAPEEKEADELEAVSPTSPPDIPT